MSFFDWLGCKILPLKSLRLASVDFSFCILQFIKLFEDRLTRWLHGVLVSLCIILSNSIDWITSGYRKTVPGRSTASLILEWLLPWSYVAARESFMFLQHCEVLLCSDEASSLHIWLRSHLTYTLTRVFQIGWLSTVYQLGTSVSHRLDDFNFVLS